MNSHSKILLTRRVTIKQKLTLNWTRIKIIIVANLHLEEKRIKQTYLKINVVYAHLHYYSKQADF